MNPSPLVPRLSSLLLACCLLPMACPAAVSVIPANAAARLPFVPQQCIIFHDFSRMADQTLGSNLVLQSGQTMVLATNYFLPCIGAWEVANGACIRGRSKSDAISRYVFGTVPGGSDFYTFGMRYRVVAGSGADPLTEAITFACSKNDYMANAGAGWETAFLGSGSLHGGLIAGLLKTGFGLNTNKVDSGAALCSFNYPFDQNSTNVWRTVEIGRVGQDTISLRTDNYATNFTQLDVSKVWGTNYYFELGGPDPYYRIEIQAFWVRPSTPSEYIAPQSVQPHVRVANTQPFTIPRQSYYIGVQHPCRTVTLPAGLYFGAPYDGGQGGVYVPNAAYGMELVICDETGSASASNITVQTAAWYTNFFYDGSTWVYQPYKDFIGAATNTLITNAYGSIRLLNRGTNWARIGN